MKPSWFVPQNLSQRGEWLTRKTGVRRCLSAATPSIAFVFLSASVAIPLGGCARVAEDIEGARAAVAGFESSGETSYTARLYRDALSQVDTEDPEEYAEQAELAIYETLTENFAGCVSPYPEDNDPSTVGAQFSCSGENGLLEISGTLSGKLTPIVEGFKVVGTRLSLSSDDLEISGRPIEGSSQVEYIIADNEATLDSAFTVTDANVGAVDVMVNGVLEPSQSCVTFNGVIQAVSSKVVSDVTVTEFERCEGSCPSNGGQAVADITDSRGQATLTINFDGSEEASVTSSRGRTFTVPLTCGQ